MLKPVEPARAQRRPAESLQQREAAIVATELPDDFALPRIPSLPADHPAWRSDVLDLSERGRLLFAQVEPLVLQVLGFWDQVVRMVRLGTQCVLIDASGSYRLE